MRRAGGFILPLALLACLVVVTLLSGAFALASLRGKLGAAAARRAKGQAAAEGAVWLGIAAAAADLIAAPGPGATVLSGTEIRPEDSWLPAGAHPLASPLIPPGTGLWVAPRSPGRVLVAARSGASTGSVRRVGHLEYLETTPNAFGLWLDTSQDSLRPAIGVCGRAVIRGRSGVTLSCGRLQVGGDPPRAEPTLSWSPQADPGELVVLDGPIRILAGAPPSGRTLMIGETLPANPILFPPAGGVPERLLVVHREAELPDAPLPDRFVAGANLFERLAAAALRVEAPPPFDVISPQGSISWREDRISADGVVVIEGDVALPAGTTYSGTAIVLVAGDLSLAGDLLPERDYPGTDSLTLLVGGTTRFGDADAAAGTVHALISTRSLALRGDWTVFGSVFAGAIEGPAEASLMICPPPWRLLPLAGTPLAPEPSFLLLEAGCRDPDVRFP